MSSSPEIRLVASRANRGVYPVSLMQGEEVLLAGRVNPHKAPDVDTFVEEAIVKLPGITDQADELRKELLQLAAPKRAPDPQPETPYLETPTGLVFMKPTSNGSALTQLTNFTARIVADVVKDDGTEQEHAFEIHASLAGRQHRFAVRAAQFASMNWPIEHMGAKAIIYPGSSTKDHTRAAIQMLSKDLSTLVIYTHTGWRKVDDAYIFLHGAGAIGQVGPVLGVEVELPNALSGYAMPDPPTGDELRRCIRASMGTIELAPDLITLPAFCAVYRAPLGACDMALHLGGPTGAFKSELAALCNQHFGAVLDARHLPGHWASTDNALEGLAFTAKDVLLTIDDFAPAGTTYDIQRLHQKADRIIRAQGNHSGRQRMRADGTLRPTKPPRGLILSTGEDIPRGQSLRARMLVNEIGPGDIDSTKLSQCQEDARGGLYAGAMAGYVRWLAGRIESAQSALKTEITDLRQRAVSSSMHRRTPEVVANLALGLRYFLKYAQDARAITAEEYDQLRRRGWEALGLAAAKQQNHQVASEPTRRFLDLIESAIASGHAHMASPNGSEPSQPEASGWRLKTIGAGQYARDEWQAQGDRIGWLEGEDVYLDSDAAYRVAQQMAGGGDGISISAQTLRKRMDEKGLLIREGARDELTVRRKLEGKSRKVLWLSPGALLGAEPAKPAKPANTRVPDPEKGDLMAGSMAGLPDGCSETRHRNPPLIAAGTLDNGANGGNGGNGGLPQPVGASQNSVSEAERERIAI